MPNINGVSYYASPIPDRKRAERMAEVKNQRARDALPLFAAEAPTLTADEIIREAHRSSEEDHQFAQRMYQRAQDAKDFLRASLPAKQFARLEERRKVYPDSIEYEAGAWCDWLREYQSTGKIADPYSQFSAKRHG